MSQNTQVLDVPIDEVWSVIADGWTYSDWVVGAAEVRDVDAGWPEVGTNLHHTVGVAPVHVKDTTQVVEVDKPNFLALRARVRPIGQARITFALQSEGDGTRVTMTETVDRGFAARFYGLLMRSAINARNTETLHRLQRVAAERRSN